MSAVISKCGTYRYMLGRSWLTGLGTCAFIMLNPSTADAEKDDPTIRRCIGFAQAWGYARLRVGNLYAYRATKPADLWDAAENVDICGYDNDDHLIDMARESMMVVAAWGASNCVPRAFHVQELLKPHAELHCLGMTKHGYPRHPLYVAGHTLPVPFTHTSAAEPK